MVDVNTEANFAFPNVLFLGRDFAEYQDMFDIATSDLKNKSILDCAAGPSSFAAEAARQGFNVTACDPLYGEEIEQLKCLQKEALASVNSRRPQVIHLFHEYALTTEFQLRKQQSLSLFLEDFRDKQNKRYIRASLPELPFKDSEFDLVLSANFLFLYASIETGGMHTDDVFDYEFHVKSLLELARVSTDEIRIYPIKGPHKEERHQYFERLMTDPRMNGLHLTTEEVKYRDIRDAHDMLILKHR